MRRNVFERALATFWQTAAPAFLAAILAGMESGDYTAGMVIAALVTGAATGLSAVKNKLENRRREGPEEQ